MGNRPPLTGGMNTSINNPQMGTKPALTGGMNMSQPGVNLPKQGNAQPKLTGGTNMAGPGVNVAKPGTISAADKFKVQNNPNVAIGKLQNSGFVAPKRTDTRINYGSCSNCGKKPPGQMKVN